IREQGGKIERVDSQPGSPVCRVYLTHTLRHQRVSGEDIERVLVFPNLKQLIIDDDLLSDDVLRQLHARGKLHLLCQQFWGAGLTTANSDDEIVYVFLRNGLITDAGLKELDDLKGLQRLCLITNITGEGLKTLARRHRNLRELSLLSGRIKDADLKELASLS